MKKDRKYKKRTKDNCELCGKPLSGEMIFHPNLCLSCVIDYDSRGELRKLRKYEKKWVGTEAVNGVDCKSIIREFKSHPALKQQKS